MLKRNLKIALNSIHLSEISPLKNIHNSMAPLIIIASNCNPLLIDAGVFI